MAPLRSLLVRLRALFLRNRVERELDEELRFHIEQQTKAYVREGLDPGAARRRALVAFGGVEQAKEAAREARGVRPLEELAKDARFALRAFAKRPAFTTAAVLTLALGIGGNAVMFAVLDALFLRPPAGVAAPERVSRLYVVRDEGGIRTGPPGGGGSYLDYRALREGTSGVVDVTAFLGVREMNYERGVDARRVHGRAVTGNFFSLLGVRPAHGRLLVSSDADPDDPEAVAVLGHGFWRREFGGDPGVVGRSVPLNGRPVTVVGVAAPEFTGIAATPIDVWIPLPLGAHMGLTFGGWREGAAMAFLDYVARLEPGASPERVTTSAAAALTGLAASHPELDPEPGVILGPLNAARGVGGATPIIALLLGAVTTIVLLIACANVANLLLARATARRRELSVRLSLGAGPLRVGRQLLTESVLLGLAGGAAGLLIAFLGTGLVRRFPVPAGAGRLDARMLGFTLVLAVGTGVLFGLAPAIQAARTNLLPGLQDRALGLRPSRGRLRRGLIVGQVALTLVLLVGAGLFVRSLRAVTAIDPGIEVDRLLVASVDLGSAGYDPAGQAAFYDRATERLRALPGVDHASVALLQPLAPAAWGIGVGGVDWDSAAVREGPYRNVVGRGFFETAGIPILHGRTFEEGDAPGAEPVAVVNERLAALLAPGGNAAGMCVPIGEQIGTGDCTRIVGVAADARHRFLNESIPPFVYLPRTQRSLTHPFFRPSLLIRVRGEPDAAAPAVRAAIQGIAPDLPYVEVQRMETTLEPAVRPVRLGATLFSVFGMLAMILAAVGLSGVLAYAAAERTREVGVRKALGARESTIVGLVVGQGMRTVALGLAIGLAGALAGTRVLGAVLHGVSPRDPWAFAVTTLGLAAVALVASWLPARRAARVDPLVALRAE